MKMDYYISRGGKKLRCGYTTGTCAAAAAKSAAYTLLTGEKIASVILKIPKGITLHLDTELLEQTEQAVIYAVQKDAGDDPDITDGITICAKVEKTQDGQIIIKGGDGVGRVTKPGLACGVGEAAINPTPRAMILEAVQEICFQAGYGGGLCVTIFVPKGASIAAKTYNPHLGIEGGISILGTSGMVEPMSEQALLSTIEAELKVVRASGHRIAVVSPGNYGMDFAQKQLGIDLERAVKCSNFIGEAIDMAAASGFAAMLLIGHAGKLVKIAGGIMNTHSKTADARMEILTAHAALAGAGSKVIRDVFDSVSVDNAFSVLQKSGYLKPVMERVTEQVQKHLERRAGNMEIGAIIFSNQFGLLGKTVLADKLCQKVKEEA